MLIAAVTMRSILEDIQLDDQAFGVCLGQVIPFCRTWFY